jgi:Holliday junction resolvasome RuvABC endonuclease subunit
MRPFYIMIKVLGLDISSATIGWSILSMEEGEVSLSGYGHISPPKSKAGSLTFRASKAFDQVLDLIAEKSPEIVVVESYANKFPAGRSTARTIIVLSVFNEIVSMAALRSLGQDPERYPVVTIRSKLSKLAGKKISSKEECFDFICDYFPAFTVRKNRNDNISKECFDEADAIAAALTYYVKEILGE